MADKTYKLTFKLSNGELKEVQFTVPEGKPGDTPYIGLNGNWYIGDDDTGVKAEGNDGITPHIGSNGNWFIGDTDTGVKASGKDGEDGEDGYTPQKGVDYFDGEDGQRGTGLLPVTTAPSTYTTAVNGLTPAYRIALSKVKSEASVSEVYAGDTLRYSYYHYPVIYVDSSYAYCRTRVSIRGATGGTGAAGANGTDGKSAYQYALDGGYTGTEEEFVQKLATDGYVVAQPEPPENTKVLWFDTDDNEDEPEGGGSAPADWNAAEGEPGHILNRTHYDYIAKVVEEITINASSQDTTFTAASPIVIGETYSIHWGDEIYVCEAVDGAVMGPEGAGFPLLGNYGNLIGGTNTGEPFVITVMGTNGMVIGFGEDIEITFSIDGKTTKKISEKYLPAFVKSCIIPVNSLEDKTTKITLDTTELAEAIKNNYPIYVEKIAGYNAERYTVNRVLLTILPEAGITTMTQAIDWHIAMGYSVSNLPVHLYFSDGWGDNSYSVYININE